MPSKSKESTRSLPATPWGLLPPRLSVLFVTTPRRTGAWLAESFAADSACHVDLSEAHGAAAALARLRETAFDALLVGHEPGQLDALELLDALRGGGAEESLVVLGQASEQEMSALCFEAGADAYVCVNTTTTRNLLWIVARAVERRHLLREHRRLSQAEKHRRGQDQGEARRLLDEQRTLIREASTPEDEGQGEGPAASSAAIEVIGRAADTSGEPASPACEALKAHYRELMRAHVMMGSGNLGAQIATLAETLAEGGVTAPQTLRLHVEVLEELVQGLGSRGTRHVMSRADLLVLEVLVHLAEGFRRRLYESPPRRTERGRQAVSSRA